MLTLSANPLLHPRGQVAIESELRRLPHLRADRRHDARLTRRLFRDARKIKSAVEAVGKIPDADEALHLVVSGRFALWHFVPAVLALAARPIEELRIATLGFSRANIAALCDLIDAGRIGRASLLCSHYFQGTSAETYSYAERELGRRSAARFVSLRSHAKLVLLRMDDGRTVTIESSANLRSCKNIEQCTVIGSPQVHDFHAGWIDQLFAEVRS